MSAIARVALGAVLVAGVVTAPAGVAAAPAPQHAAEFLARLADIRAAHGVGGLRVHDGLQAMARRWAQVMADRDDISHNPNMTSEAPPEWIRLGENVGVGMTVDRIHDAFAASETHRKNLLQPDFTHVGIGVVTGRDGALFVTQNFMTVAEPPPPEEPPPSPPPGTIPARVRPAAHAPATPAVVAPPDPPARPRALYTLELISLHWGMEPDEFFERPRPVHVRADGVAYSARARGFFLRAM